MENRLDKIEKDIQTIQEDMAKIKKALLGDSDYNELGMKRQHDELWEFYASFKYIFKILGFSTATSVVIAIVALLKAFKLI